MEHAKYLQDTKQFAFGSVAWQNAMACNIAVKTAQGVALTDYEQAFVATQSEHNARIRTQEQTDVPASYETQTEQNARKATRCAGCGASKAVGLVVCWSCFKYGEHAFKYSGQTLDEWLQANADRRAVEIHATIAQTQARKASTRPAHVAGTDYITGEPVSNSDIVGADDDDIKALRDNYNARKVGE